MTTAPHHVFLVPGFFGFTNFGELKYFAHVKEALEKGFAQAGVPVSVHRVRTSPTASIERRAHRLLEELVTEAVGGGPIHIVGHSTGGLDARLLVSTTFAPGRLPQVAPFIARVGKIVTVSTPHKGSPVATFLDTAFGAQLLKLLSLMTIYTLRLGPMPTTAILWASGVATRLDAALGASPDIIDQIYSQLLADFSPERRQALEDHFREVASDTSLIQQLSPEGIEHFNAMTPDREGVSYGAIVTRARPPTARTALHALAVAGPYAQATHAIYHGLHRIASRGQFPEVLIDRHQAARLVAGLGRVPGRSAHDGMVPTLSQVRGTVIEAVRADHLDVIGHFDDPTHVPPHYDWLYTGSGFKRPQFDRVWDNVAAFLLALG